MQKILARAGIASRRAGEEFIRTGRVCVNGRPVELGARADPASDEITVDGRRISLPGRSAYLMLHKPAGYVCTRADPEERPTVYELVPDLPGLFTVGRLDLETEGLLLLTTDGAWAERLAHPRYNVEREYEVHVRGPVEPAAIERLRAGVWLEGRLAQPVRVFEIAREGFSSILTVVMVEGRRREVRSLCAAAGLPVRRLVRRRFGALALAWLEPGHWRFLSPSEVAQPAGRSSVRRSASERGRTTGGASTAHRDRRAGSLR